MSSDGMRQMFQIQEEQGEYENLDSIEQKQNLKKMKEYTEDGINKKLKSSQQINLIGAKKNSTRHSEERPRVRVDRKFKSEKRQHREEKVQSPYVDDIED